MRLLLGLCLMFGSWAPRLQAEEAPKIAQGERIDLGEIGFSIIPPTGWEIKRNSHGSSLLFEAPKKPGQIYQATIQVMVFSDLRYIDAVTQKEYGDLLVEKFGRISNRVTGYNLRSSEFLTMESGDPAILYYTEFHYDDVPIMQMHILISSASNHFLMSYTDITKTFEEENSSALAIAYASMHSAQLATHPAWRYQTFLLVGIGILCLIVAWFILRAIRGYRMNRIGQRIEDEDSKELQTNEESQFYSRQSMTTGVESGVDEWRQLKQKSKAQSTPQKPMKAPPIAKFDSDDDDEADESDVVPLSTLEKSLHPARKKKLAQTAPAAAHPQPTLSAPARGPAAMIPPPLPIIEVAPAIPTIPEAFSGESPARIAASDSKSMQESRLQPSRSQDSDDGDAPEMTEEARLSQILPRAGTIELPKPKRKGLFWRKKASAEDDSDDQDDNDKDDSPEVKDDWAMKTSNKTNTRQPKVEEEDDDDEREAKDQWAIEPTKKLIPDRAPAKDHNRSLAESQHEAEDEQSEWAPEPTKRSHPKKDSLLNETNIPRRLVGKAGPLAAVTKGEMTHVTEDGWNLKQQPQSEADDDDEESAG